MKIKVTRWLAAGVAGAIAACAAPSERQPTASTSQSEPQQTASASPSESQPTASTSPSESQQAASPSPSERQPTASPSRSESPPTASESGSDAAKLAAALASADRPAEDKARDADRKPAELLAFFGVQPGMTALDVIAIGGYLTEVLSVAVGPRGKVYMQNPPVVLESNDGAYAEAIAQRVANNRLPNVVRLDADLPASAEVPVGSVDVAISAMNYHDIRHLNPETALRMMKGVYTMLKPGGIFGVIDHVGNEGADNKALHRVPKRDLIEDAQAAGFIVEAESDLLANPADDHTKIVLDPALRGKTDQFTVRLRKPK